MSNDPNRADASSAVTVEHVLAALDHIQQTVQAIRNALSGLAPELTLMENGPDGLPKVVVGRCPPPEEGRVAAASSAPDSPKPKEVAGVCPPPEEEHVTRAATDRPKLTVGICPPPDEEKGGDAGSGQAG